MVQYSKILHSLCHLFYFLCVKIYTFAIAVQVQVLFVTEAVKGAVGKGGLRLYIMRDQAV